MSNLVMLHPTCHWQIHGRSSSVVKPRPEEGVFERLEPDEVKVCAVSRTGRIAT
jgi:hypothetical protein